LTLIKWVQKRRYEEQRKRVENLLVIPKTQQLKIAKNEFPPDYDAPQDLIVGGGGWGGWGGGWGVKKKLL